MAISALDFANFLHSHNPDYRCPFCGSNQFHMNVQAPDLVADLAVPVQQMGIAPSPLSHNFYSRSCQICGHTDWYHKAAVQRWLGSRPFAGRVQ
jgi:predicted nucleic-acid-binding Zn-ribbon protein